MIGGVETERNDDKGRTTERDERNATKYKGKYTKRKTRERILNDRPKSKYTHVLKSRPAVRI